MDTFWAELIKQAPTLSIVVVVVFAFLKEQRHERSTQREYDKERFLELGRISERGMNALDANTKVLSTLVSDLNNMWRDSVGDSPRRNQ